jgi:hypothetical protein
MSRASACMLLAFTSLFGVITTSVAAVDCNKYKMGCMRNCAQQGNPRANECAVFCDKKLVQCAAEGCWTKPGGVKVCR